MARVKPVIMVRLDGVKELRSVLRRLPIAADRRVMKGAVGFALTPMLRRAKLAAPKGSTGLLQHSMIKKTKVYKAKGVVWGGVGPRTKLFGVVRGRKESPTKYGHIVEGGSRSHKIPKQTLSGRTKAMRLPAGQGFVTSVRHPGTRPTRFLLKAWNATKSVVAERLRLKIQRGIAKEAKKLAAGSRRRAAA